MNFALNPFQELKPPEVLVNLWNDSVSNDPGCGF